MINFPVNVREITSNIAGAAAGTAYAAGDAFGVAQKVNAITIGNGQPFRISKVVLTDLDKQSLVLTLVLFNEAPTSGTDNAAFDLADADLPKVIGRITILAADTTGLADNAVTVFVPPAPIPFKTKGGKAIWYQAVIASGTPTLTTANAANVTFTIERQS
jgi:hypothetical protein